MCIFVLSLLILLETASASRSRSVNLELETVLEFDKSNDIDFLKTVQQFIDKVKDTVIKNTAKKVTKKRGEFYTFTDLLEKTLEIVKSFQNDEIRNVFNAIDEELKEFNPKSTLENNFRRFLTHQIVDIKRSPMRKIHKNLDDLLRRLRENNKNRNDFFLNFVNTLYKKDTERKYMKLFNRLNVFRRSTRRTNDELRNIIRTFVHEIIQKYSDLIKNDKFYIRSWFKNFVEKSKDDDDDDDHDDHDAHDAHDDHDDHDDSSETVSKEENIKTESEDIILTGSKNKTFLKNTKKREPSNFDDSSKSNSHDIAESLDYSIKPKSEEKLIMENKKYMKQSINIMDREQPQLYVPTNPKSLHHIASNISKATQKHSKKISKLKKLKSNLERTDVNHLKVRVKKKPKHRPDDAPSKSKTSENVYNSNEDKKSRVSEKSLKLIRDLECNSEVKSIERDLLSSNLNKKLGQKLTHVTFYPITIEIDKNKKKSKFRSDFVRKSQEVEKSIEEEISAKSSGVNEIVANHSIQIKVLVNKGSQEGQENSSFITTPTPLRYKLRKQLTSTIVHVSSINKTVEPKNTKSYTHSSFEHFGSLHRSRNKKFRKMVSSQNLKTNYLRNKESNKIRTSITADNQKVKFKRNTTAFDIIRRANKDTENKTKNEINKNKVIKENTKSKTINEHVKFDIHNNTTVLQSTKNTDYKISFGNNDSFNEIIHNDDYELKGIDINDKDKTVKEEITRFINIPKENITNNTLVTKPITKTTTVSIGEAIFNINNFIKNSDIQNEEDDQKKKEIEHKMKEDLNNLFLTVTNATSATTEKFTDVFKDLEDAFDLSEH